MPENAAKSMEIDGRAREMAWHSAGSSLRRASSAMPEDDQAFQESFLHLKRSSSRAHEAMMAAVKRHFDAEDFEQALPLLAEAC